MNIPDIEDTDKWTVLGDDAEKILEGILGLRRNLQTLGMPDTPVIRVSVAMKKHILAYINDRIDPFGPEYEDVTHLYGCEVEWVTFH